jgi:hypothetical protein
MRADSKAHAISVLDLNGITAFNHRSIIQIASVLNVLSLPICNSSYDLCSLPKIGGEIGI